jgi:alpha-L-fucosidase
MQHAEHPWEESRGMGYSYGYNRLETLKDYHTDRELLMMVIDIVSRDGNVLLDIGPTADGWILVMMEERLLHMGDWLRSNGEAIYGTRPWRATRLWREGTVPKLEEKEYRASYNITQMIESPPRGNAHIEAFSTAKDDAVYAILPRWARREVVRRDMHPPSGTKITLLDTGDELRSAADGDTLRITAPPSLGAHWREAYTLRIPGAGSM